MHIKQGIIPTVVGTAVTATGVALKNNVPKMYSSAIVGFGLAHIVLGSVDMIQEHKAHNKSPRKHFNKVLHSIIK